MALRIFKFYICLSIISIQSISQKPVIIEFGWDYPNVALLSERLDSMQHRPFDGICFSFQQTIMESFDTTEYKASYFEYSKLKKLKWGKFTDNYIFLRGLSKTGGSWFKDQSWINIARNMNRLSQAMTSGNIKGILFDPEYYYENALFNPWTYSQQQYPDHTFEEVQQQVLKRGTQFIKALQQYKKDFNFLSIWLTSLVAEDYKLMPLEKTRHALLPSFIEGMLLGKNPQVKIIDGNEYAYWNIRPSQFVQSAEYLKNNTLRLMQTAKGKELAAKIEIAQPIFYDGLLARHPSFNKGIEDKGRWKWLEENLKLAIASSTSNLVWFYNERVDWWKGEVNDTLVNILQNSKKGFVTNFQSKANDWLKKEKTMNVNSGVGEYYLITLKTPMKTEGKAFTYSWNNKNKELKLDYIGGIPATTSIFINNVLSISLTPEKSTDIIKLKKFSKGKLGILTQYKNDREGFGISIY